MDSSSSLIDPFVGPFTSDWPWASSLPGARLVAARFDPDRFDEPNVGPLPFERGSIALPPRLHGAIAKRRAEYVAGRLCARRALRLLDGRDATPSMNEDRSPCWPAGCVGAITHSDGWAAALVAHRQTYQGVGLDAERLLNEEQARRLATRVLTAEEIVRMRALPPSSVGLMVSTTFSLKESLFKALYPLVGRMFHFPAAELMAWHGIGPVRLRLLEDLGNGWTVGREVTGMVCLLEDRVLSLVALPASAADRD
ncbi:MULTISPECIES: 4'-phosphopantetheinyl transferase [unclassified Halomonas]|jgi:enterobactin synthetase component D|uniref:Enterobactin synthase component D n=2 Tax=Billgrantia aerodenitrificans TaxID=2733483 RepID=A0ABS9ARP4_9GAMM|nr:MULTISPECIES: 4'-phosphopantetheinyl transferase superfamily protein [Halomonas]MCE8024522.1 4'-phosphopantetheinyl transferase superfamily protein [Halomonas aerodenitrificans]MCE8036594.1 4'-phosphopantetheinyl transferase superfamily protein [Halomonas sp. MCCC 1A11062]